MTDYAAFMKMFNSFFETATMVGTYKAVFLKSLADIGDYGKKDLVGNEWICPQDGKIHLDLNFIAARFAKYYWDMEIAFGMRHIPMGMASRTSPKDDVAMIKLVREEAAEISRAKIIKTIEAMGHDTLNEPDSVRLRIQEQIATQKPPTLPQLASSDMREFRENVIKKGIKPEVLKNLLKNMPDLYERVRGKNYIKLDRRIIEFMEMSSPAIKKALNYMLAEHLEKNNPDARYIAIKINSEKEFDGRQETVKDLQRRRRTSE